MKTERAILWYAVGVGTLCLIAFLSNPLSAMSALFSGIGLVTLALCLRYLMTKNPQLAYWLLVTFLVLVTFGLGYRAFVAWGGVFAGREAKIIAATCITGIVLCSLSLLGFLFKSNKQESKG